MLADRQTNRQSHRDSHKDMLITINKLKRVCVQPCTAAANATPLAFAAERRTTAAPAAIDRNRLPAANPPQASVAIDRSNRQTERRTDGHGTVT